MFINSWPGLAWPGLAADALAPGTPFSIATRDVVRVLSTIKRLGI